MKTTRAALTLAALVVAGVPAHAPVAVAADDYDLRGRPLTAGEARLAAGAFVLTAGVVPQTSPQGGGYVLTRSPAVGCAAGATQGSSGCGCLCSGVIFADGFESGDTTAWSASVP